MNQQKVNHILKLSAEERYLYFIRKITDFETVWGLHNEGWALVGDSQGKEIIPFWPEKEFAELCAVDSWNRYLPRPISLSDFLMILLVGM
jgi:hypothetical protein